ncbi:hypothetical protein AAFF_G00165680 [Aldrovandia affinis]|uniref:Uncharacterized protein n=1 Tax=Aldrovandia affinis TaxID=143900 RepID=A0AAD7RMK0_9TELE|nr:hypothetical protein AAFF_G00165680 [Aldrovandia affinis]
MYLEKQLWVNPEQQKRCGWQARQVTCFPVYASPGPRHWPPWWGLQQGRLRTATDQGAHDVHDYTAITRLQRWTSLYPNFTSGVEERIYG